MLGGGEREAGPAMRARRSALALLGETALEDLEGEETDDGTEDGLEDVNVTDDADDDDGEVGYCRGDDSEDDG